MIGYFLSKYHFYKSRKNWRKLNMHNRTSMDQLFDSSLVDVGRATYGSLNIINYSDEYRLSIGSFCSIGPDVTFIVCGDHTYKNFSTFPFKVRYKFSKHEAISKGDIVIEDDVWIGTRSIILSGVRIGQGAVISAGAVVSSDIPPYSIVGGIPAKVLKSRFSENTINKLLSVDFSKIDDEFIRKNIDLLYKNLESSSIISQLPQK